MRRQRLMALVGVAGLTLSCSQQPAQQSQQVQAQQQAQQGVARSVAVLLQDENLANSFYACILNGIAQHLPLKQIQDDCETKLKFDGRSGTVGGLEPKDPAAGLPGARDPANFDPATVSAACSPGDRRVAAGGGEGRLDAGSQPNEGATRLGYGFIGVKTAWGTVDPEGYTFGGKGQTGNYVVDSNGQVGVVVYKGLTEAQAKAQKEAAIAEFQAASKAFDALVQAQTDELSKQGKKPEEWVNDPKMKTEREAAQKRLNDAVDKKNEDPNVAGVGGISSPAPSNACQIALQAAREIVGECQRTGWRSGPCKQLQAKMTRCPDPALIYVDPDGYACRPQIDPEAVRTAWVDACRELKRPVPGGPDPCAPPEVDSHSRFIAADPQQICGGPEVNVTPDNPDPRCVKSLDLPTFSKTIHQIYVWGLNKLGGPIVVFGPKPGTETTPSPKPKPI